MAGKKQKLTPDMFAFSRDPLHQRTVSNWRESVVGLDTLSTSIYRELVLWLRSHGEHMQDVLLADISGEVAGFILSQCTRILSDHGDRHDIRLRFWRSDVFEIEHNRLSDFLEMPLASVHWEATDGIKLLLLLLTYRTFIEEKIAPVSGLPFNITIPGCVYTCFRLGVGVEA